MQIPAPAALAIETALNSLLKLDDETRARLPALAGKVIDLHLEGLELHIYLLVHADTVEVMRFFDGQIDTTISGTPLSMASLTTSNREIFSGRVKITGDVEVGKRFKRLLDSLQIDWEEQLSKLCGDVTAHWIGNLVRDVQSGLEHAVESFGADLGEYLREESRLTPTLGECNHYCTDVDTLRADVDRLETRLQRLQTQGKPAA